MDFTKAEIINLIIKFCTFPAGCWIDIAPELPEVRRFINSEYVCLNEENDKKYVLNEQGRAFLHTYIEQISMKFIDFMKEKGCVRSESEVIDWFVKTYALSNRVIGEDICDYICRNLSCYGYYARIPNPERKDGVYKIEPLFSK